MVLELDSFSRFRTTKPIAINNRETFGLWNPPSWIKNISDSQLKQFVVSSEFNGRPDLISTELYGSPIYFWVLLAVNKPLNPLNWPINNTTIFVPIKSIVISNI